MNREMLLAGILLLSGCAFKSSTSPTSTEPVTSGSAAPSDSGTLSVDWTTSPDHQLGDLLKAVRTLTPESNVFRTSRAVTLPSNPPETAFFTLDLPSTALIESPQFVRATLSVGERAYQLHTDLSKTSLIENGKTRITVLLSGFKSVFGATQHLDGVIEWQLFGNSKKLVTAQALIRTPPSEIKIEQLNLQKWKARVDASEHSLAALHVGGQRLILTGAISIQNNESLPVEIHWPRRPHGVVSQWNNQIRYRDLGCTGPGYALDQAGGWLPLSSNVFLLPINEGLLVEAQTSISSPSLEDSLTSTLAPKEEILLGEYALGPELEHWIDIGLRRDELSQITIPTTCYNECVERVPVCVRCLMSTPIHPAIMECVKWETRRKSAVVTVGIQRGDIVLNIPQDQVQWPVRFADNDSKQDGETRRLPLVPAFSLIAAP